MFFKIIKESIIQAFQELNGNRFRSFLSLTGISIGIFCIIGVQTAVDSLQENIVSSFDRLGSDVIFVSKFSWTEDPGANYAKIIRRPNPSYEDFEILDAEVKKASAVSFSVGLSMNMLQYKGNSIQSAEVLASTRSYQETFNPIIEKGRFFSPTEYTYGANSVVIGYDIAEQLFGAVEPVGKKIKLAGRKLEVIGVLEQSGESLINVANFDNVVLMTYENARKFVNLNSADRFGNTILAVKARDGVSNDELKTAVRGVLRAHRRLKPKEEDDFSLNEVSMLGDIFDKIFSVLNLVGFVIGIFAIIVGMFSVANIMFVSVKERTNIIGVKKALGAKRYMILFEFLIESVVLCLLGGMIGLLLIYLAILALSGAEFFAYEINLSTNNILSGFVWSTLIGVIAGVVPAAQASLMDPVEAIRQ